MEGYALLYMWRGVREMNDMTGTIKNYPDISFIGNLTLEELQNQMIIDFSKRYKELTGKEMELAPAHPYRLILYAASLQLYQAFQYLDQAGKQSFLKYAYGDYLDNLGALKGIARSMGERAKTIMRFILSKEQAGAVTIPKGTRVTTGNEIYFYTTELAEIPAGELNVDVQAECTEVGILGNGLEPGAVSVLVDLIPYVQSVSNANTSAGGQDVESDENLRERIHLAPAGYSVAGPDAAYQYWTKKYNSGITDVKVTSPSEGIVDIRFIMEDGELPEENLIEGLKKYLSDNNIRPLTDKVQTGAPELIKYNIDLIYYISRKDASRTEKIRKNVEGAVETFKIWQQEKIGRDINPSKLLYFLIQAEAKRADIMEPAFTVVPDNAVARIQNVNVVYGGIEDD